MKAKKLIEVAMPIKEISAESVRDKSIRHGHISTLHLWWARRPLPACRAIVFGSLVPDPDDENCPQAFKDAVAYLLKNEDPITELLYRPYKDIPYTAIIDPMEDTLRNRLMMFIGKFGDKCQDNMIAGNSTPPKEQLSDGSLIKWENKNNSIVLGKARELIFVAYNADRNPQSSFESLHREFGKLASAITAAEDALYSVANRHLPTAETQQLEKQLHKAIEAFQSRMPSVFDPFAGGGAIPLEAARLGCRSYGNDINPVAHIIERGSAEFPQKYGKPITYTEDEFNRIYGERGRKMLKEKDIYISQGKVEIPNRLAWDVEFFAKQILDAAEKEVGHLYPADDKGRKPVAYYWARTVICSNPACKAEVPLLRGFYLANKKNKKVYLQPIIDGKNIRFEIKNGTCHNNGWVNRGSLTCPCCGSVTDVARIKEQSVTRGLKPRLLAIIYEDEDGKSYSIPNDSQIANANKTFELSYVPVESMTRNSNGGDTFPWGYTKWGDLFSNRQLFALNCLIDKTKSVLANSFEGDYKTCMATFMSIFINRITPRYNMFSLWNSLGENIEHIYRLQAIQMSFDFPEANIFSSQSGGASNQINWMVRYIEAESDSPFSAILNNCSSGEKLQFDSKFITSTVTDPPYYDAIAYADCSDFFYTWHKQILTEYFPQNFATPQTPKTDECTALKYHHNGDENKARVHFEDKLTEIFDAIGIQTSDVVSIMFAHQSTKAWTTLCNSILDAKMNITGSWPIDSERSNAGLKTQLAYLESSVTVSCRPSERKGFEEFRVVEQAIKDKVKAEIEKLYELGFRGADLLTACFGQAVSEFGKYKVVERADGKRVTVAELLELARQTAFDTLLQGIKADELTRFYIGWLQMNGMGETNHDDVTKFTRVGVNVDIHEVIQEGLLVSNGSKNHLATADEHIGGIVQGTLPNHPIIDQVHRAMLLNRKQDNESLLKLIRDCAPTSDAQFWRVLASLKEMLPAGKDLTDVQELLRTADYLRTKCKEEVKHEQASLFDL